jgi:hypothetical protein
VQVLEHRIGDLVDGGGAARAAVLPLGVEHEVLDDELAPALEDVGQPHLAVRADEAIVLFDPHHRHAAAVGVQGVLHARELLLTRQQGAAGGAPLVSGGDLGQAHAISSGRRMHRGSRGLDAAARRNSSQAGVEAGQVSGAAGAGHDQVTHPVGDGTARARTTTS